MKKLSVLMYSMVLVLGAAGIANAILIDNLDGTITQIRVDGSTLMWLEDANYAFTSGYDSDGLMTWDEANDWIETLKASNHLTYNDWRLPYTNPVNGSSYNYILSYDGSTDYGWNISASGTVYDGSTGSEMGYMYYKELENSGSFDTSANPTGCVSCLTKTGLFTHLQDGDYFSGTEYAPESFNPFAFNFGTGHQDIDSKDVVHYAWAVRNVTPIPEPTTMLLLGSGLFGLAGLRRKFRHS